MGFGAEEVSVFDVWGATGLGERAGCSSGVMEEEAATAALDEVTAAGRCGSVAMQAGTAPPVYRADV